MANVSDQASEVSVVRKAEQAVVWHPGSPLPAELATGHPSLDFEHRQLLACMTATRLVCQDLRRFEDCSSCIKPRRNQCESELVRLLGDLLAFIIDHFKTEEAIMRDSLLLVVDRDLCEAHMEDHAAISATIQKIVASIASMETVAQLRELDDLLGAWITNHITLHDLMLARWVEREDSVLKHRRVIE